MTNFFYGIDITKQLKEIDNKLLANENDMTFQCEEILKTEKLISEYQGILREKAELLQKCISDKEKLAEDRNMLLKLLEDPSKSCRNHTEIVITKPKYTFEDEYEIASKTKSLKFYRAITDRLSEVSPDHCINYLNQTVIPNQLKACTTERKMRLYRVDVIGEYLLNDLVGQPVVMTVDIHVSMGTGELISLRNEGQDTEYNIAPITSCKTYSISQSQTIETRFMILVTEVPMVMGFDVYSAVQTRAVSITDLPEPEGYAIVEPSKKYRDSFIKRSLSFLAVRSRLLFVDAKFAESIHKTMIPIELSVIDYNDKVLINTVMCPREQIRDYCESEHGLTEKSLLGAPDSEEMMKYFYSIVWDKVLIGHNMEHFIRDLKIDLRYLCGIKDLQTSLAVREFFDWSKKSYGLGEIAEGIFKQPITTEIKSSLKNVQTLRNIYIFLESKWHASLLNGCKTSNTQMWGPLPNDLQDEEEVLAKKMKIQ